MTKIIRTNTNLQNNTQNSKYREQKQSPLRTRDEHMCSERVRSACSTSGTHRISLDTDTVISHE
jgi:hypothetical protein